MNIKFNKELDKIILSKPDNFKSNNDYFRHLSTIYPYTTKQIQNRYYYLNNKVKREVKVISHIELPSTPSVKQSWFKRLINKLFN